MSVNVIPQFLWPDVPRLVSESFLRELDKEPAGTWLAQSKIDGRRRIATKTADGWEWRAKNKSDALPLPDDLRNEFESLGFPVGVTLDLEYSGLRQKNGTPELYIFDVLAVPAGLTHGMAFVDRLKILYSYAERLPVSKRIHFIQTMQNPGMELMFNALKKIPTAEGIVVRKATSTMRGHPVACQEAKADYYKVKYR